MKTFLITSLSTAALSIAASACDICSASVPLIRLENHRGWHVGVTEQYTAYETLRLDGRTISDPASQYFRSSITQFLAGYDFTPAWGVQVNLPLIHRSYRRVEDGRIESGNESGIGDLSILANWTPVQIRQGDFKFTGRLTGGIKLPTGDSSRLREEGEHGHTEAAVAPEMEEGHGAHEAEAHHHEAEEAHGAEASALPPGGVHGHDLALGSGSMDGILGADFHAQWKRLFFETGFQITVRGEGDHDFDYADDLGWHAGIGAIPVATDDVSVAIEARVSGEAKGEDKFRGERLSDTSSRVIYAGPRVTCTWRDRVSVDVGVEFPLSRENSGVAVAPDYRVKAGVGWQF